MSWLDWAGYLGLGGSYLKCITLPGNRVGHVASKGQEFWRKTDRPRSLDYCCCCCCCCCCEFLNLHRSNKQCLLSCCTKLFQSSDWKVATLPLLATRNHRAERHSFAQFWDTKQRGSARCVLTMDPSNAPFQTAKTTAISTCSVPLAARKLLSVV